MEELQQEVLRLPRLTNIQTSEVMFDNNLGKLFYPHYHSHRSKGLPEASKDSNRQYLHKPKSKSVSNLEINFPSEASRMVIEDSAFVSPTKEPTSLTYQKRLKHYHHRLRSRSKANNQSLEKPSEPIILEEPLPIESIPPPKNVRAQYNAFTRKQKQESLKSVLVVEKQKIDSSELRIRAMLKNIFPLTSEMAMSQFIDRFQHLRKFAQKAKDEEKKVNKVVQSTKHDPARKLEVLKEKKHKLETDLENQYKALFDKYFKEGDGADEAFKKKFRKHITALSKTFNLEQLI